jgi:hypothetical protein
MLRIFAKDSSMDIFSRPKPSPADAQPSSEDQDPRRFAELKREIEDADGAVAAAKRVITEYCERHPNAHAVQINSRGLIVRLNAMTADPQLTALEHKLDVAKERFAMVLSEYADLEKKLHPEVHYVGGIEQQD